MTQAEKNLTLDVVADRLLLEGQPCNRRRRVKGLCKKHGVLIAGDGQIALVSEGQYSTLIREMQKCSRSDNEREARTGISEGRSRSVKKPRNSTNILLDAVNERLRSPTEPTSKPVSKKKSFTVIPGGKLNDVFRSRDALLE